MVLTNNGGVITAFINKSEKWTDSHNHNLRYSPWFGGELVNYRTVIAKWDGDTVLVDSRKYSRTTSKIQTQLKNALMQAGIKTAQLDH